MTNPEDLLQERLERLEAGEPLVACLEGVPGEIAAALKTAARLKTIELPARSPEKLAAQRSVVMGTLGKKSTAPAAPVKGKPDRSENKWTRGYRLPVMAAVAMVILACAFFTVLGGTLLLVNRSVQPVAKNIPFFIKKAPAAIHPDEAMLLEAEGLLEVSNNNSDWVVAEAGATLTAGTHLRTASLSSAVLAFYDDSQVKLGPDAELVIDELHGDKKDGSRQVILTQVLGQSQHQVARSSADGSRYEVRSASAISTAQSTQFSVLVRQDESALISVSEGEVAVTGQDVTVLVESGQATLADIDEPPSEPAYFFTGQGEVAFIGETWVIAGQALKTHVSTVVIGNPQLGDTVFFEGRMLPDETRLVDLIVLLRRSPANRFSLTGTVEAIAGDYWTVNGQQIAVSDITRVDGGIVVGSLVYIEGLILPGGSLQAETIRRLDELPGMPFDFVGVVGITGSESWTISGIEISVNSDTTIDEGLAVGDLVRVMGWILEDNTWRADSILRSADDSRAFEFVGAIQDMDPWVVAGIEFETVTWTEIDDGLAVGDQVIVKGQVMEDGTWLAHEIRRLHDLTDVRIVLVGVVFNMDPWVVSGITLPVDSDTIIADGISLGMLVRVEIQVLPDGTWKVLRIAPLQGFELLEGCQELTAVVVNVSGNQLQLQGWPALTIADNAEIVGEVKANSVVLVQLCFGEDGSLQVVYIFIILQPEVDEPPNPELPGEMVMICHKPNSKNPHVIVVSRSAVPAHLGHGDVLGPCP